MPKFTLKFDTVYAQHAPAVPLSYLRALAGWESNSNPKAHSAVGWGLLQVSQKALDNYNKARGTDHRLVDTLDPALNVKVFATEYKMFLRVFRALVEKLGRARGENFIEDWSNPQFAKFVTMAWNSGIGALKVSAGYVPFKILKPATPITANDVFFAARSYGGKKLKKRMSIAKQGWQAKVVGSMRGIVKAVKEKRLTATGLGIKVDWKLLLLAWLVFRKRRRR